MRFLSRAKDGGPKSTVTGHWLIELKRLFSVVLLRFDSGSRDEFHEHAFNSLSWVLSGMLIEQTLDEVTGKVRVNKIHTRSLIPVVTRRSDFHRVHSVGTTRVLSLRGPWRNTWREYDPAQRRFSTLTHGRRICE